MVQYSDSVLKSLPDVRTVIALRQRLQQSASQQGGKLRMSVAFETKDLLHEDLLESKGGLLASHVLEQLYCCVVLQI